MSTVSHIPRSQHNGFESLVSLPEKEFKIILNSLLISKLTSSVSNLADEISEKESLSSELIERILFSVGGLILFIDEETNVGQVVEQASLILKKEIKGFDAKSEKTLKDRLLLLLKTEQIYYAAKSMRLKGESNNVFLSSRIITDIRPIFSLNINETPKAGVVIHNLHIHFSSSDEGAHRDVYFALDSADILALEGLIKRAKDMEASLKMIFDKSKVKNLD